MCFDEADSNTRGGVGTEQCAALINEEFERIFYKMNYALKVTVMNIYMVRNPRLLKSVSYYESGLNALADIWGYELGQYWPLGRLYIL